MTMAGRRGFTIVEILFVILILSVVTTIVVISFSKLNSTQALRESTALVTSILNEARSLTLSSKGDSQYGVHFEDSQVVLFKGATYSPTNPLNISTRINALVGIRNVTLAGGGADVVFRRLTGETTASGTVELFLQATPETVRVINIRATGLVEADS
ncbi:MAG: type II secretion system protein [Parcubacteria group bacterium]